MTHFIRNKKMLQTTLTSTTIILIVLDQKLKHHEPIGIAVKRGVAAVLTLKCFKNFRFETARRLNKKTVTPVKNYTSVIWAPNASKLIFKKIEKVSCQAVIRAFKRVSLAVAASEATLTPHKFRLLKHQLLA